MFSKILERADESLKTLRESVSPPAVLQKIWDSLTYTNFVVSAGGLIGTKMAMPLVCHLYINNSKYNTWQKVHLRDNHNNTVSYENFINSHDKSNPLCIFGN